MQTSPNLDQIEIALGVNDLNKIEDINFANALINDWVMSPLALNDSVVILNRSSNPNIKFKAAAFMKRNIYTQWGSLDAENHQQIIASLLDSYFNGQNNENINEEISISIGKIAVFVALSEWPTFFTDCCFFDESTPLENRALRLQLFTKFCTEIEGCNYVNAGHITKLRELCIGNTEAMHNCIVSSFGIEQVVPYAIRAFNCLLNWCNLEDIINVDIMKGFCIDFLGVKATQKPSVECLQTIFIKRTDSNMSFRKYAPLVIFGMSNVPDPINPTLPVTANVDVLIFLTKFLARFLSLIDLIFFPIPEDAKEEDYADMMAESNSIMQSLNEFEVSKENFAGMIATLFQVVLSSSPENITSDFWKLFNDITRKIYFEKVRNPRFFPIYDFFKDFFPQMRESIYQILPKTLDEEGLIPLDVRSCWSMLLQIDSKNMAEFLTNQELSENLCVALAGLEFAIETDEQTRPIFECVPDLLNMVNDETPDSFLIALLCAVSHSARYLKSNREVFVEAVYFICECIGKSTVAIAAVNALAYTVCREEKSFLDNNLELASTIISNSDNFFENADKDSIRLLYIICSRLIVRFPPETIPQYFKELFLPIQQKIEAFSETPQDQNIMEEAATALDIITETVQAVGNAGPHIAEIFVPILIYIGPNIYPAPEYVDISTSMLLTFGSLMTSTDYRQIEQVLADTLNMLPGTLIAQTVVFQFIAILRQKFHEVNTLFPAIMEQFIQPALQLEVPPLELIFNMLKEFDFTVVDPNFVVSIFQNTIPNYIGRDVNFAAFECWATLLRRAQNTNGHLAVQVYKETFNTIMGVTFSALIDQVHNSVYDKICEFIMMYMNMAVDFKVITPEFNANLVQIISSIVPEPYPGVFEAFVTYIGRSFQSMHKITKAIQNFMFTLHKVSPIDTDIFKIEEYTKLEFIPIKFDSTNTFHAELLSSRQTGDILRPKGTASNIKKAFRIQII